MTNPIQGPFNPPILDLSQAAGDEKPQRPVVVSDGWRSETDYPLHESEGLSLYGSMRPAYLERKQVKDPETEEVIQKIIDLTTQLVNELCAKKPDVQGQ